MSVLYGVVASIPFSVFGRIPTSHRSSDPILFGVVSSSFDFPSFDPFVSDGESFRHIDRIAYVMNRMVTVFDVFVLDEISVSFDLN